MQYYNNLPIKKNFIIYIPDATEQFDIHLFASISNVSGFFFICLTLIVIYFFFSSVSGFAKVKKFTDLLLDLVKNTVENNMSNKKFNYTAYMPVFYLMFFSILIFNLAGLFPFTYTISSLLIVPFFLSGINFFFTTFIVIRKAGLAFLGGFLPAGTNIFIAPLLILIEIVSYAVKVVSLAVRLFANMFAGHVLIKVLLSLAWSLLLKFTLFPFFLAAALCILILAILVLELFICFLQAYVFINLASIYLDQAVCFLNH